MNTSRRVMSTTGSHQNRPWSTIAHSPPSDEHLVGQRVEERPGAGGALPTGQVAVEAVGGGQQRPEHPQRPARLLLDDHPERERGDQQPGDRDDVRRREDRGGTERAVARSGAAGSGAVTSVAAGRSASTGDGVQVRALGAGRCAPGGTRRPRGRRARGPRRRSRAPRGATGRRPARRPAPACSVPISSSRRPALIGSASSRSSARRSSTSDRIHRAVQIGGVGAVLERVGEEAAPVELRRLDEAQQLVVVLLGLARVADDEVRAERGVGAQRADLLDALQVLLAVAPPPHAPHQRRGHVLERQVEVRHRPGAHQLDQLVGELGGVQVQQPHPVDLLGDAHGPAARSTARP